MANLRTFSPRYLLFLAFIVLTTLMQSNVFAYQYKVGDLDAWGIPTSENPQVYAKWSKYHTFKIGDSLLFLYPPSQDSVMQVTAQSYNACDLKDPILSMNDGNSVFNITSEGELFFISGQKGHCEKKQKIQVLVGNVTATAFSPAYGPSRASSYPTVFGTIPAPPSSSSSLIFPLLMAIAIKFVVCGLLLGDIMSTT